MNKEIIELLVNCEHENIAPDYKFDPDSYKVKKESFFKQTKPVITEPIKYSSTEEEIFVVSDLHIAAGRNNAGVYQGIENFFADESFERFLQYANKIKKTDKAILIINGDIFDFLRVVDYPGKTKKTRAVKKVKELMKFNLVQDAVDDKKLAADEFEQWSKELNKIGITKSKEELEKSISKKEKEYGLRTDDYKTIYKLIKIKEGHPAFFTALSDWLHNGNKIIVLKGNHDVEIFWLNVRNYLRLIIAEQMNESVNNLESVLKNKVLPNIHFIDDSILIDDDFYVEHGHRYDKFTMILDDPKLSNNKNELNIPFGSFFNRYLINRIELIYPFLDNVRPTGNILPMLMKHNFPLGLKILFHHIPFMIKILFKNFRYLWFMIKKVVVFLLAVLLPVAVALWLVITTEMDISDLQDSEKSNGIISFIVEQLKGVGMIFLSYLLSRLTAWFQLAEPSSLKDFAEERMAGTNYKIMTMGHTHNPGEYIFDGDKRFYNTGTWIPIVEHSSADIREDKTYAYLHLERDKNGKLVPANNGLLQRWNDSAGRHEPLILVKSK